MSKMQLAALVVVIGALTVAPMVISEYNLSLLGRFLALGVLAVGLSLLWGHAGILSLGQGLFFGLGGYALAMHLKLVADGLPDFMVWNGLAAPPWWWLPFQSPIFTLAVVLVLPGAFAGFLGWLFFRRRITGVYIALITQALALGFATLVISQQGTTGGFNGLTNFKTFFGLNLYEPGMKLALYWVTVAILTASYLATRWLTHSHTGKLLVAIRDGENRVRFLGYDPAVYKAFAFGYAGFLAGVSGALYTLHLGVISPLIIGVVPSIEMVIGVAAGGREVLSGAIAGTVLIGLAKDRISSAFPDAWLYVMGAMFILVVTVMPAGLGGVLRGIRFRGPWHMISTKRPPVEVVEQTPRLG